MASERDESDGLLKQADPAELEEDEDDAEDDIKSVRRHSSEQ